jgi:hypothetical protein
MLIKHLLSERSVLRIISGIRLVGHGSTLYSLTPIPCFYALPANSRVSVYTFTFSPT